jgi:hypothetical protein
MGLMTNMVKFTIGHINLLKPSSFESADTFTIGKAIVHEFRQYAGDIECRSITGQHFETPEAFSAHMTASSTCRGLIERAAEIASRAIFQSK